MSSSCVCSLVNCLKFDRRELPEAPLPAFAMAGPLDPGHDRSPLFLS